MNFVLEGIVNQFSPGEDTIADRNKCPIPVLPMSPALDAYTAYLHEEMRQSYLNGLDHAAIVTACALLEYTLKEAVYSELHFRDERKFNKVKWNEVESKDFSTIMNWAKSLGILSKAGHKQLESFRNTVRNNYMHGTTPDRVKKTKWQVFDGNWKTGEVELREIELNEDLSLQRMCRLVYDRMQCAPVVEFVDKAVRDFLENRNLALKKWEEDHPGQKPTREQFDTVLTKLRDHGFEDGMAITRDLPIDPTLATTSGNKIQDKDECP